MPLIMYSCLYLWVRKQRFFPFAYFLVETELHCQLNSPSNAFITTKGTSHVSQTLIKVMALKANVKKIWPFCRYQLISLRFGLGKILRLTFFTNYG